MLLDGLVPHRRHIRHILIGEDDPVSAFILRAIKSVVRKIDAATGVKYTCK